MLNHLNFYAENLSDLEKITIFFIGITPIGYYLHPAWLSNFYAISALLCTLSLIKKKSSHPLSTEVQLICLVFIVYPLAIFLSQLFRWEWQLKAYHDQSRFLLALPIFLFLYVKRINFSNLLTLVIPAIILTGFISSEFIHPTTYWAARKTVDYIDPLAFGQTNMLLGLACLATLITIKWNRKNTPLLIWLGLGLVIAIYQSILSQSRTGWLALLLVPALLLMIQCRFRWQSAIPLMLLASVISSLFAFEFVNIFRDRLISAYQDIVNYPWSGKLEHETSLGFRITFWRIGWFYFTQSPIWGWGDKGFAGLMNSPQITVFANRAAIEFCYNALFHNEWVTQAVRYGLLGIGATAFVFWVSLKTFWRYRYKKENSSLPAMIGVAVMITIFSSSLSNEVFNLKHLVTIHGFLLACLLSATLLNNEDTNQ